MDKKEAKAKKNTSNVMKVMEVKLRRKIIEKMKIILERIRMVKPRTHTTLIRNTLSLTREKAET